MIRKIFYSLLIIPLLISCDEDGSEAFEEVFKVEIRSVNDTENQRFFILIENDQSPPVFKEFQNYSEYTFLRNGKIKGEKINIHTISVNTFGNSPTYNITSFTSAPVGRTAIFGEDNILTQKSATSKVNLEFENIPDFDVVTRSVQFQRHCQTQKAFFDNSGEPSGNTSFPANETFYACFQSGNEAKYFSQKIETSASSFKISFDSLSSQMEHFYLPKKMGDLDIAQVSVMGYNSKTFAIQLFNLSDISIYSGNTIDLFIPKGGMNLTRYQTEYSAYSGNAIYSQTFFAKTVINTPEILNAELTVTPELGRDLNFSISGNLDFLSAKITYMGSSWTLYGIQGDEIYYPDFPLEFTDITGVPEFVADAKTITLSLFDYSELDGYTDALNILMDDSKQLMDSTGLNYKSLSRVIQYSH